MTISVRQLQAEEWQLLKQLRLRALAEAPDAFSPRFEDNQDHPDSYWQTWATRVAKPYSRIFVGNATTVSSEAPLGLISAERSRDGVGHLGAFWTDPRTRGTGLGSALFDAAMHWLEAAGCRHLELSVTEGNGYAEAMYARRGFARDGRVEPLRDGSTLRNIFMVKQQLNG